jgi:hypothetical protein
MASQYESACVKAVQKAFDVHWKLTGGLPLTFAPEAFIQGQIAIALARLNLWVTLESKVYEALTDAGAEMRGRSLRRGGGRLDLISWWKNGSPRHLIEVKKLRHTQALNSDAKRLAAMLRRGGTTRQGLIVIYADAARARTVEERIDCAATAKHCTLVSRSGPQEFRSRWNDNRSRHYEAACIRVRVER